jgi:microcin C transport system substrate-binding protein
LKKRSKKLLLNWGTGGETSTDKSESFLLLFFKKEALAFLVAFLLSPSPAHAATTILSLSTAPQPPPNFTHLPYANPNAPKGGSLTLSAVGDFDNLNPFILAGTAPDSIYEIWQPLFKPSDTDSVTAYAELAQSADISPNNLTVTFHLNQAARFSDGTQVTAADVVWTYHSLVTQGAPIYAQLYAGISSAAAPDPETAVFTLRKNAGRAQILNLAEMYVLPAHFWNGTNFAAPLLRFPVGSGAYQVAAVSYGNFITYTRVKNWWGAQNPADRGFYNFDRLTEQFFRNDSVALQAFKAGQIDARIEHNQGIWPAAYANQTGLALEQPPITLPSGINGLVMNTRRPLFADSRVRHALALAFDFQWTNRVLFHGAERRETSYFSNSPMASSGPPSRAELALLAPFRNAIPQALFSPFTLPVTAGTGDNLPELRQAMALLNQAGWQVQNFRLQNPAGQPFTFEILLNDPHDAVIAIPYAADLRDLGITVTIRTIDQAAYQRRLATYDFDMTTDSIPATDYPDTEQSAYWSCTAAAAPGGDNWAGACSPAIDAMIAAEIAAPTLAAKTTAIHALDRLLLNNWYFIPFGVQTTQDLAYWPTNVAKPDIPLQIGVDFDLWWAK